MPAALSSPKIQIRLTKFWGAGFHIYCPVCGHNDLQYRPRGYTRPLFHAALEDAYYRAECMYRDHYPYGGDCGDWMSDGSEDL